MKRIVARKQRWLPTLVWLLMGIPFANAACGQDVLMPSLDLTSTKTRTPPDKTEFDEMRCDVGSGCLAGQIVITNHRFGRIEPVRVRPEDDVWLISARDSHLSPSDLSLLQCSQLVNGVWEPAELDELVQLHSTDKTKVTMLYVHGDRTNLKWATSRGLQFYQTAFQTVRRPPLRFVIFAWRAERERARPVPDYDVKCRRSILIGETLGKLLCRFDDRKMVVGGFSLGAQIVLAAMSNPELQARDDRLGRYRVAVFAHVLNTNFVQSDLMAYPHNPIVHQTDVFINQGDRAVKFSHLIGRKLTKSNCSLRGLADSGQIACNTILIRDITHQVSKKHAICTYGRSRLLNDKLAESLNATFEARGSRPDFSGATILPALPESVRLESPQHQRADMDRNATVPAASIR